MITRVFMSTARSTNIGLRIAMIGLVMLASFAWGFPAQAMQCGEWTKVSAGDRDSALQGFIRELLDDPKNAQWTSVNKGRVEQCLLQRGQNLKVDFDDACSKGLQTSVDALYDILVREARSCVQVVR